MDNFIPFRQYRRLFLTILLSLAVSFSFPAGNLRAAEKSGSPDLSTAIIQVARQNIPAVVHIEVTERQEVENPRSPFENDPFFRRFFNIPQQPRKFKRETKGLGTGMLIDDKGHILTNHHVAGGATKIEVLLSDGRHYDAKLVGTDPKTDLAVIKINAKGPLPHVTFGDSDKVEVGEWVVAIGHPRGLDQTVTQGIISAKHRQGITDPGSYQDFLQTDAAINPGNSGGPLLNLHGEVIGVNAVIVSQSGGFEGIGFTIPSNMAFNVAGSLIAHGKVERGWAGVSVQDVTPELARSAGAETTKGAFIADVVKGGPADRAGLRKNDIVVAYGGKTIDDAGSLRNEVAGTAVGSEAAITVLRKGNRENLRLTVGNLESSYKILTANVKERLGIEVRSILPKEVQDYGLNEKQGVAISWIDPRGPLGAEGFEVRDLLLGVDNQPIEGMESFIELAGSLKPRQKVTLLVVDHRTGNMGNIQINAR